MALLQDFVSSWLPSPTSNLSPPGPCLPSLPWTGVQRHSNIVPKPRRCPTAAPASQMCHRILRSVPGEQPQTQPKEMVNRITTGRDPSRTASHYTVCSQRADRAGLPSSRAGETEDQEQLHRSLCSSKRTSQKVVTLTPRCAHVQEVAGALLAGLPATALLAAGMCPSPVHLGHVTSPGSDFLITECHMQNLLGTKDERVSVASPLQLLANFKVKQDLSSAARRQDMLHWRIFGP